MRTLHPGFRVADLDRALAFYGSIGYEVVGSVPETDLGRLTMLKLPDDEFVTIELVSGLSKGQDIELGNGLSHLAVQVDSMQDVIESLRAHGVDVTDASSPDGTEDF
jgi:lactoylglutathione lyase